MVVDAVPPETATGPPMVLIPSLNCTVPAAEEGRSVAVSVSTVFAANGEAGDMSSVIVVGVGAVAPPVPLVHWVSADLRSQGEGCGTLLINWSEPSADNVRLWQLLRSLLLIFWEAPGIWLI